MFYPAIIYKVYPIKHMPFTETFSLILFLILKYKIPLVLNHLLSPIQNSHTHFVTVNQLISTHKWCIFLDCRSLSLKYFLDCHWCIWNYIQWLMHSWQTQPFGLTVSFAVLSTSIDVVQLNVFLTACILLRISNMYWC